VSSVVDWVVSTAAKAAPFLRKFTPWITYIQFAIAVISWLKKPDIPDSPTMESIPEQNAKGVLVNKTSSNAPLPVIYGQRKVGGTAVFMETSGTDNTYLYMIMALCEGGVESCEKIYIDDKEVTWSGALGDATERTVNSSDSNFYKAGPTVDGASAESTISVTWYDGDKAPTVVL
jgi:hypothetical protein